MPSLPSGHYNQNAVVPLVALSSYYYIKSKINFINFTLLNVFFYFLFCLFSLGGIGKPPRVITEPTSQVPRPSTENEWTTAPDGNTTLTPEPSIGRG